MVRAKEEVTWMLSPFCLSKLIYKNITLKVTTKHESILVYLKASPLFALIWRVFHIHRQITLWILRDGVLGNGSTDGNMDPPMNLSITFDL